MKKRRRDDSSGHKEYRISDYELLKARLKSDFAPAAEYQITMTEILTTTTLPYGGSHANR